MKRYIFRVETEKKLGPYRVEELWATLQNHNRNPRTPNPVADGFNFDHAVTFCGGWNNMYFAFDNLNALYRWFTKEERDEVKKFCRISVIEIDDSNVIVGNSKQCIFQHNKAVRLGNFSVGVSLSTAKRKFKKLLDK